MMGTCVRSGSWFAVVTISRVLSEGLYPYRTGEGLNTRTSDEGREGVHTSQPQPEPWMAAVVALNSAVNLSTEPQVLRMASLRAPSRRTPPLPLPSDAEPARFFQKSEWLMWPARGGQASVNRLIARGDADADGMDSPPPLNLRTAWRAMRSLGVEAFA